jgi:t-SNARE complex subunit (syntaxin)
VVRAEDSSSRDMVGAIDSASAVASAHSAEAHSMLRNIENRHAECNQRLRNTDKLTSPGPGATDR